MSAKVFPLKDNQLAAVQPSDNVWLSASAGTGKTQVLSARVLRLLLRPDVEPGQILCLTFTKAGAAEMAIRINAVLARWVRLGETKLAGELRNLGAPFDRETLARAHFVCQCARLPWRRPQDRHDPRLLAMAPGQLPRGSEPRARLATYGGSPARIAGPRGAG